MFTLLNELLVKQDFKSTGHCIQGMEVATPITPPFFKKKDKKLFVNKEKTNTCSTIRLKQPAETEHQKIWEWKMI